MTGLPEVLGFPDQYCLKIFVDADFSVLLVDFQPKPCAYLLLCSAHRIKISDIKEITRITAKHILVIRKIINNVATHIYFVDIQVTNSEVGFNSPMSFLSKIPHNVNCEFVVWNVNCFAIIGSNNCWGPPAYMLKANYQKQ